MLPPLLAACLFLIGCSVNPGFNQLDFVKRLSMYQTKAELEAQLWTVKIGEYEQIAIPVEHEGSMTFYLKDGTEIDFRGWDVTALRNWNHYGDSIDIERSGVVLIHSQLDGDLIQLECSEYQEISEGFLDNGTIRSARCRSEASLWSYTNAVVIDDQGRAIWMLHHIDQSMPPLEMRLNGSEGNEFSEISLPLPFPEL